MEDVIIIGGGIIGCSIAYELSHFDLKITLVEKNHDLANEVSMANSAIVHAGYDPEEGTLKGKLNVRGSRLMKEWCEDLQVEYVQCGAYVAACGSDEEKILHELYERALKRGIKATILNREDALKTEPNLSDQVSKVMHVPETAIITPWNFAIAAIETALVNGAKLFLDAPVTSIERQLEGFTVTAGEHTLHSRYVINAAGLYSDVIDFMATKKQHFTIQARKGEYFVLSKDVKGFVSQIIYPIPGKTGKGVLAVPTVHGNTLIGPNRVDVDKSDNTTNSDDLTIIRQQIQHTLKDVPLQESIRTFSGLRPSGNDGDFYIQEEDKTKGFINVGCIDSPGIASAPAIGEYVRQLIEKTCPLKQRDHYQFRRSPIRMDLMTLEAKQELIKQDSRYGHIICRCEKISEGEIIDAINRPCGARSLKAVKKRVRPGMGRCQGGFCEPLVTAILAKTLKQDMLTICYDQADTQMFVGNTKEDPS